MARYFCPQQTGHEKYCNPPLRNVIVAIVLIFLGLFLWFALAFNGSVGVAFVNYTFFASALFMLIAGGVRMVLGNSKPFRFLSSIALVLYIPMVWQRFNFNSGVDLAGLIFDIFIVVFLILCLTRKTNP
jgi:hypothetical protein